MCLLTGPSGTNHSLFKLIINLLRGFTCTNGNFVTPMLLLIIMTSEIEEND